jgi:hypothetical protein
LTAATIESALPVLPLVASTMVSPCRSSAFDHVLGDAGLHGARRVQVLQLAVDALYLEQGRPADGVEDAVG